MGLAGCSSEGGAGPPASRPGSGAPAGTAGFTNLSLGRRPCALRCSPGRKPAPLGSRGEAYGDSGRDPPGDDTLRDRAPKVSLNCLSSSISSEDSLSDRWRHSASRRSTSCWSFLCKRIFSSLMCFSSKANRCIFSLFSFCDTAN